MSWGWIILMVAGVTMASGVVHSLRMIAEAATEYVRLIKLARANGEWPGR